MSDKTDQDTKPTTAAKTVIEWLFGMEKFHSDSDGGIFFSADDVITLASMMAVLKDADREHVLRSVLTFATLLEDSQNLCREGIEKLRACSELEELQESGRKVN